MSKGEKQDRGLRGAKVIRDKLRQEHGQERGDSEESPYHTSRVSGSVSSIHWISK